MSIATIRRPQAGTTERMLYRLSVEQYHAMITAGVLREGEKVELLEGLLVEQMTRNPPHDVVLGLVDDELRTRVPAGWALRIQAAITTTDSEPEPDVVVVPGPRRRYLRAHPGPSEIAIIIEVADTSLDEDRTLSQRIYARARLPIYWIVNIPERQIEVYTQPRAGRNPTYRQRRDYLPGESVPVIIAGKEVGSIPVEDILP
jgi:Uma2 family endonuclease